MFQTKVVEKPKTHILHPVTFFEKSCRLRDNVEKHGRAGEAIVVYSTAHARYVFEQRTVRPLYQQYKGR